MNGPERDVLGWQETRWGMLHPEVEQALGPDMVVRLEKPRNRFGGGYGGQFGNRFREYYCIEKRELPIGNTEFAALPLMRPEDGGDRLHMVILRSRTEFDEKIKASEVTLIRKIVSEKFGPAKRAGSSDRFYWRFPTTTISMVYQLPDALEIWFEQTRYFQEEQAAF